jgi:RNA polymerase sigma factor
MPPGGVAVLAAEATDAVDVRELVRLAQLGDGEARETVLRQLMPMAVAAAARHVGRFVHGGRGDEPSVALLALNEAIDAFRPDRSTSFSLFAVHVVRRRLVDHYRRSRWPEVPLSSLESEDAEGRTYPAVFDRQAMERFADQSQAEARREEIGRYRAALRAFGLDLADLARLSPRRERARRAAMAVAHVVAQDPMLRMHLLRRRELPLRALAGRVPVSRKTLERRSKYIVAVTLVLAGDFPHLREYVVKGQAGV